MTWLLASSIALAIGLAFIAFLLLGVLRTISHLAWRMDQLEASNPSQIGRNGLKPGTKAPDFKLPNTNGQEVALQDFAGHRLLLVFTQPGCGPCQRVVPALNALQLGQKVKVLAVGNGDVREIKQWAELHSVIFPVLHQEHWRTSRRYQVLATPFAFLIDEDGIITAKGLVNNDQHLRFLFSAANQQSNSEKPKVWNSVN